MSSDETAPRSFPPRQGGARPAPTGTATSGESVPTFMPPRTSTAAAPGAATPPPPASSSSPVPGAGGWPSAPHDGAHDTGDVPVGEIRHTSSRTGEGARPAVKVSSDPGAPRRVRLAVSRVDPWSVMKLSFLLSVAVGIMIVVAAAVVWLTLDGMHVFTKVDSLVREVVGTESKIDILQYVKFSRIVSAASLIAIVDVFLMTALATIGAFLYNIVAALVGGIHLTMTDE